MAKIAINTCFGGFGLSPKALALGAKLSGNPDWDPDYFEFQRHDPVLIKVIETLGVEEAGGSYSSIELVEVPDGTRYRIHEYDGRECVITFDSQKWEIAKGA